jgi:hypothetical protein
MIALRAGRAPITPRKIRGTHIRGWVDYNAIMVFEGLGRIKHPVTSSGKQQAN